MSYTMSRAERSKLLKELSVTYKGVTFSGSEQSLINLTDYKEFLEDVLSIDLTPNADGAVAADALEGFEDWEIQIAITAINYKGIPWDNNGEVVVLSVVDLKKIITKIRMGKKRIYHLYFTSVDLATIESQNQIQPVEEVVQTN